MIFAQSAAEDKPSTIQARAHVGAQFMKFLDGSRGHELIMKKMDKHTKKKALAFSTDEVEQFLRTGPMTESGKRNKLIMLFSIFSLGCMEELSVLKWEDVNLDIIRNMVQSVSKESILEAGVKQVQAGEKQKKMKKSTLNNKKIKVTSKLNIAAIESKKVLFSKFFKSQNNCKKDMLIASKLMTWKPENMQKLFFWRSWMI
eukprot:m51a1_g11631 hypothetical protein (201) ;mRNA; r:2862-7426